MYNIESYISQFVESMFPQFYLTEGTNFVAFIKAYYEWLEQNFQYLTVADTTGLSVDDVVTQIQSDTTIAEGVIYSIDNDKILVKLNTFQIFHLRSVSKKTN